MLKRFALFGEQQSGMDQAAELVELGKSLRECTTALAVKKSQFSTLPPSGPASIQVSHCTPRPRHARAPPPRPG